MLAEGAVGDLCVFFPGDDGLLQDFPLVLSRGQPEPATRARSLLCWWWVRQQCGQLGEALIQSADLHVLAVHPLAADLGELVRVVAFESVIVNLPIPRLVACFAHATPDPSDRIMLGLP